MSENIAARVYVCFTETASAADRPQEQGASYCASGRVFLGVMQLLTPTGRCLVSLPVQSGGWMCEDSPFRRDMLCPADPTWGAYDPLLYPDTAFPALAQPTTLGTLRTGRYRGFRIPDPPGTGRRFLMVPSSTRYGSEGCISCPPGEDWELFCSHMAQRLAQGVSAIPLQVVYECPPPCPRRCPAAPAQR